MDLNIYLMYSNIIYINKVFDDVANYSHKYIIPNIKV